MSPHTEVLPDGTFVLKNPVDVPETLDVLIVGGGPCGTAAAFRAKELGLATLLVELDDLLKRIRDYAKDKMILPNFGGGDKMKFPAGEQLVSLLHFSPIDKDDMCAAWKGFYREHCIAARVGVELTGLERGGDGVWSAKCWNHRAREEQTLRARHVVIALGRGVPRRFDIPGNTDGIAFRLDDASAYVGAPACVIGGGTSAAEAVIAISNAKTDAGDPSCVYWSYRGATMPRVSKALADVFFGAYMGNGNIRYYPKSEPVAVVTADDKRDYLSIRIDRRRMGERPSETSHLEFPKENCIACIGEDIPEGFLNSLGIEMATGGRNNKKRMVVTRLLETQQENVYLAGDILSQAYFETEDFAADPSAFKEVRHRGNVKSALRDGVYVVEVIKQRLAGKKDVHVTLAEVDTAVESLPDVEKTMIKAGQPVESAGPPAASVADDGEIGENAAWLVALLPGGVEGDEHPVRRDGITTIGRKDCDINFPEDTMLSDKHASVSHGTDGFFLRDDGSSSGVFLKAPEGRAIPLAPGTLVRAGRQFLLFPGGGDPSAFVHYDQNGKEIGRHHVPQKTIVLGRDAPDIVLDAKDKTLSRRHLALAFKDGDVSIKDLKSVNGTYLRVKSAVKIESADQFRVGQHSFVFTVKDDVALDSKVAPPAAEPAAAKPAAAAVTKAKGEAPPAKPEKKAAPAPSGAITVTFKNLGQTLTLQPGQTICAAAEAAGLTINAECHAGVCGSDPIRVLQGGENLNDCGDQESETLEDICELKPGECRMACMAKPTGPVVVEIIQG